MWVGHPSSVKQDSTQEEGITFKCSFAYLMFFGYCPFSPVCVVMTTGPSLGSQV